MALDNIWQNFITATSIKSSSALINKASDTENLDKNFNPLTQDFITALKHKGLLKISGRDAKIFLQGQLTCDLNNLGNHQWIHAVYCNHQGKAKATMILWNINEEYYIQVEQSIILDTISTLQNYAKFSKVIIEDITQHSIGVGIKSASLSNLIDSSILSSLQTEPSTIFYHNETMYFFPFTNDFSSIVIYSTDLDKILNIWNLSLQKVHHSMWSIIEIDHGIAQVTQETVLAFNPYEINYHELKALSFNKSCYLGQEIISRIHFLGKVKMHLGKYIAKTNEPNHLKAGDKFFNSENQPIATIVNVAPLPFASNTALVLLTSKEHLDESMDIYTSHKEKIYLQSKT